MTSMARGPIGVAFKALVISVAAVALGSAQGSHEVPTRFNEFTVAQLQDAMNDGRLTSERLTRFYLDRIFALDQNGPGVNSVIELNPDAIELAERADAMRRRGATSAKFPLLGIPLLLKDNIDTGDHMQTTAGSFALAGLPALQDSTVAAKLRAAGAVILGKTNLSEWANFPLDAFDQRLVGSRRSHAQSLLARSQCVRIQFGIRRGSVRELRGDLLRQRDRWQHRLSCQRQRGRRVQADDWPGEPQPASCPSRTLRIRWARTAGHWPMP
jgi:Asp-tRNAAsn/Glu-tRNAGln amidotransferase A subunit and related amidases